MATTTSIEAVAPVSESGQTGRRAHERMKGKWNRGSLAFQFFVVGGLVSLLAMVIVGAVVTVLIERAVTRNAGATTALYVDSVIAPLLPDMQTNTVLNDAVRRALDETLGQGALGSRLAALRLWAPDGTILYARDEELIGRRFALSPNLVAAFEGSMVANYDRFRILDENIPVPAGLFLEIHNPILQPWSGDVVAVIEFYEFADEFEATLQNARLRSWMAVAAVTAIFFLTLNAIVLGGSRTIDLQARSLNRQVGELTRLLDQNRALRLRVQDAAKRATTLNESYLRRLGADLHDGPAQFVALASLRLDSETVLGADVPPENREREVMSIRASLEEALQEIRGICQGLVLPQIETAAVPDLVCHAIDAYERRTGMRVDRQLAVVDVDLPVSERICIYRFLQEALNNGFRHGRGAPQRVAMAASRNALVLSVSDTGPGFDPGAIPPDSIGLAGLGERVRSLGGRFDLQTSDKGTTLTMTLDLEGANAT